MSSNYFYLIVDSNGNFIKTKFTKIISVYYNELFNWVHIVLEHNDRQETYISRNPCDYIVYDGKTYKTFYDCDKLSTIAHDCYIEDVLSKI